MTNKSAAEQIKHILHHRDGRFLELKKSDILALERALLALENEPNLKRNGTLMLTVIPEVYGSTSCVFVQTDNKQGTLFYPVSIMDYPSEVTYG